ncbi:7620_t:CDS:2, partial [Cetraspora pellucida]
LALLEMPPPKTSGKSLKSESILQAVILLLITLMIGHEYVKMESPIKAITIVTPEARLFGDALRELDAK